MKKLVGLIILLLPIYGNIDNLIEAIKKAPPSLRYKLMNQFKREIVKMNEQERIKAIKKLTQHNPSKNAQSVLHEVTTKNITHQKHLNHSKNIDHDLDKIDIYENSSHIEQENEHNNQEQLPTQTTIEHDNIHHEKENNHEHEIEHENHEEHEND